MLSCLLEIQQRWPELTAAEKRIAAYIRENSAQVIHMSVQQLADGAGSAKSAVIRCCKSLGFSGYPALKIALAADISKNSQLDYLPYIHSGDNESDILDKIFAANVKTLHDTAERIDRTAVKALVDAIAGARRIYIYGVGTSAALVNDFQYRLMQAGFQAQGFTDIMYMLISTQNIGPGDIAIGISHSGRTSATVDALRLARECGADTACITSYPGSPITQHSRHLLLASSDEVNYPMEAISARVAHMSIIDAVTVALSARDYENAQLRAQTTQQLAAQIRRT